MTAGRRPSLRPAAATAGDRRLIHVALPQSSNPSMKQPAREIRAGFLRSSFSLLRLGRATHWADAVLRLKVNPIILSMNMAQ